MAAMAEKLAAMTVAKNKAVAGLHEALAHAHHELSEHGRSGAMFDYGEAVKKLFAELGEVK